MTDADIPNELQILPQRVPFSSLADTPAPEQIRVDRPPEDGGSGATFEVDMSFQGIIHTVQLVGRVID